MHINEVSDDTIGFYFCFSSMLNKYASRGVAVERDETRCKESIFF